MLVLSLLVMPALAIDHTQPIEVYDTSAYFKLKLLCRLIVYY
jgi:hypothetical protein